MTTAFLVKAQLTEWCGCESETYLVYADTEEEALHRALDADIEAEARDFVDEDDLEENPDSENTDIVVVEYNQSEHGDLSWYKEL